MRVPLPAVAHRRLAGMRADRQLLIRTAHMASAATASTLVVSTLLEFLEVAVHGILHARAIYPPGLQRLLLTSLPPPPTPVPCLLEWP